MVTSAFLRRRKIQDRLKLTIMTDPVSDLPLPIIPGLVGYTGEKLAPESACFYRSTGNTFGGESEDNGRVIEA
jgi:hypothetical protein